MVSVNMLLKYSDLFCIKYLLGRYSKTHLKLILAIHYRIDYYVKSTNFTSGDWCLQVKFCQPLVSTCKKNISIERVKGKTIHLCQILMMDVGNIKKKYILCSKLSLLTLIHLFF